MNDYFSEAQLYKKSLKEKSFVMEEEFRNRDYVTELTKIMKETEDKRKESRVDPASLSKRDFDYKLSKHSSDLMH